MQQSPRYHFNKKDLETVSWMVFHAVLGTMLPVIFEALTHFNFGMYTPFMMIIIAALSSIVKQWLSGQPCQGMAVVGPVMPSQTASTATVTVSPSTPFTQ